MSLFNKPEMHICNLNHDGGSNVRSKEMWKQMEFMKFAQEKYSNGETTLQILNDYLDMDALYLLDEPEVLLSPVHQVYNWYLETFAENLLEEET